MQRQSITAYLSVANAQAAVDYYQRAFGATEVGPRLTGPEGKILHTELRIGDSVFMLADEMPEFGNVSPTTLGDSPVRLSLHVDDVDSVAARAVEAGAEIVIPVEDQFYGERAGRIRDPFGHIWLLSQFIEEVPAEEMQRRLDELFSDRST